VAERDGERTVGKLSYGDLDLDLLSRRYAAYYGDGSMDPLPRPYALYDECGGDLRTRAPARALPVRRRVRYGGLTQVELVDVLRTKGLWLSVAGSLALTHSLGHRLRPTQHTIAGVDARSIGEIVVGPGSVGIGSSRPHGEGSPHIGTRCSCTTPRRAGAGPANS